MLDERVKIAAVLFDLDGVLVRTERIWHQLVSDAAERYGAGPVSWEAFAPTFGQGIDADIRHFGLACAAPELEAFFAKRFAGHLAALEVDGDARALLEALRARGVKAAVVTNSLQDIAERVLEAAGLRAFFSALSCAGGDVRSKPAPDTLERALAALQVDRANAVMVGDSPFDRAAARAAKVRFAGLRLDGDVRLERLGELLAQLGL